MTTSLIWYSQRLAGALLLAVLGAALIFFTMHAAPGDPALAALGEGATPQAIAAFRLRWHLDEPVTLQFIWWLSSALRGQLGELLTVASGTSVAALIAERLPNTIFIGVYALILAVLISIAAGTIAALKRGRNADVIATSAAIFGISMPDFWLSYMLIYAFALGMGWFPAYGFVQPQVSLAGAIYSGTLPALAIAAPMAASFTRNPEDQPDRGAPQGPRPGRPVVRLWETLRLRALRVQKCADPLHHGHRPPGSLPLWRHGHHRARLRNTRRRIADGGCGIRPRLSRHSGVRTGLSSMRAAGQSDGRCGLHRPQPTASGAVTS